MWSPDETDRACEELYREFTERFWRFEGECGGLEGGGGRGGVMGEGMGGVGVGEGEGKGMM